MREHTLEEDFQHFLNYMGYHGYPEDVIDLMRIAYEHGRS